MERARRVAVSIVGCRDDLAASLMLVLMVAKMLLRRNTGFVRAVRRCRTPDQLEGNDKQQKREQPAAHVRNSSGGVPFTRFVR